LWEQEFSHIRYAYIAIDDMQESLLEGVEVGEGDEESREVPWPGAGDSSGLTIVVEDVETSGEGSGERSDDWNELVPALDITERCPAHLLVLSPHELQELAEEIHLEHSRPLTETALEILTEVAEEERNADRFADLARAFADLVILALSEADLGHGTQVLATLHTLCAERGVDAAGFLPDAADLVKQAVASIHHFAEADTTSLPELLAHLGPAAIDPVCDLLADVNHATLHPQLAAGLSLMAPRCMARVRERLMAAGNPAAGHILAALAVSPAAETEAALLEALDHHEPRVRRDALQALASRGAVSRPAVKDRMARALQDPDPQVRSAALSLVRVHAGPDMAESLLSIAEDPDFRERSPAERKAFFETLARLPGPRLRRTLREWASRQNWWPDADAAERRSLSAWALARTGEAEDRAFLARHAKSIFPSVRAAARRALAEAPGAAVEKPKRKTDRRAA